MRGIKKTNKMRLLTGQKMQEYPKTKPVLKIWPAPKHLGKHGRKLWSELGQKLIDLNLLSDLDKPQFETLCMSYDAMRGFHDQLQEGATVPDKKGSMKKNPAWSGFQQAANLFEKLGAGFGLTPKSRQSLDIPEPTTEEDLEMARLLL